MPKKHKRVKCLVFSRVVGHFNPDAVTYPKEAELIITPDGRVQTSWWDMLIDNILAELGVDKDDPSRLPRC